MDFDSDLVKDYFLTRNVTLKDAWVVSVLNDIQKLNSTQYDGLTGNLLNKAVYEMWLKTPIMESSEPVMFNFVGNKNFLEGDYGLEIKSVQEIKESQSHINNFQMVTDILPKFKFELVGGYQHYQAMAKLALSPDIVLTGAKILLTGKIRFAENMLWLTNDNCKVLAGGPSWKGDTTPKKNVNVSIPTPNSDALQSTTSDATTSKTTSLIQSPSTTPQRLPTVRVFPSIQKRQIPPLKTETPSPVAEKRQRIEAQSMTNNNISESLWSQLPSSQSNLSTTMISGENNSNSVLSKFLSMNIMKLADVKRKTKYSIGIKKFKFFGYIKDIADLCEYDDEWKMEVTITDGSNDGLKCNMSSYVLFNLFGLTPAEANKKSNRAVAEIRLNSLVHQMQRLDLIFEVEFFPYLDPKIIELYTIDDIISA